MRRGTNDRRGNDGDARYGTRWDERSRDHEASGGTRARLSSSSRGRKTESHKKWARAAWMRDWELSGG
jgi:hypothetical protein